MITTNGTAPALNDEEQVRLAQKFPEMVADQSIIHLDSFELESGVVLKNVPVAYKTWGKLNQDGSNVMVICHALTGSADVEDWWGPLLGEGRAFDPKVFFIFCANILGSPYGSASPITVNPETGKLYGPTFPAVSVRDDVRIQKTILELIGVQQIRFVIGGSLGGMLALEWAMLGSETVKNVVAIATCGRHSAWGISWGEVQRQCIYSDPDYKHGWYSLNSPPTKGLSSARMSAMLTYRSRNSFQARFGRQTMPPKPLHTSTRELSPEEKAALLHNEGIQGKVPNPPSEVNGADKYAVYSAQSYLRYQGDKFLNRFDANCYIAITRKMDTHDLSRGRSGDYIETLREIQQPTLVIGISSDGLFTVSEQYELAEHIPNSELHIIESGEGHDAFLLEFDEINFEISKFLKAHCPELLAKDIRKWTKEEMVSKASVFGEAEDPLLW
ncbi:Alpha/Beta hydrolase protein [Polychytrium aggregatum]|uniref:Alpha/Beta hydrolase protein n=1 Tax=Polychytrium aggregatum TaxID=110093 RepID=UPI0022FEFA92|nr:Alpha/Beta hydrolase protein [Polychytrium aggregatum]KAI9199207.1 Alpha/Beta hydrolase protein [Polychytrium aggregatum]